MHAAVPNVSSVTRVVVRPAGARASRPRRGAASIEYRTLHALVRAVAYLGGAIARLMPFGAPNASRASLAVESRHVADSVVPFVFQVA